MRGRTIVAVSVAAVCVLAVVFVVVALRSLYAPVPVKQDRPDQQWIIPVTPRTAPVVTPGRIGTTPPTANVGDYCGSWGDEGFTPGGQPLKCTKERGADRARWTLA